MRLKNGWFIPKWKRILGRISIAIIAILLLIFIFSTIAKDIIDENSKYKKLLVLLSNLRILLGGIGFFTFVNLVVLSNEREYFLENFKRKIFRNKLEELDEHLAKYKDKIETLDNYLVKKDYYNANVIILSEDSSQAFKIEKLIVNRMPRNGRKIRWMRRRIDYYDFYHNAQEISNDLSSLAGKSYFIERVIILKNIHELKDEQFWEIIRNIKDKRNFILLYSSDLINSNHDNIEHKISFDDSCTRHIDFIIEKKLLEYYLELFIFGYIRNDLFKYLFSKKYNLFCKQALSYNIIEKLYVNNHAKYYISLNNNAIFTNLVSGPHMIEDISGVALKIYNRSIILEHKWYCSLFLSKEDYVEINKDELLRSFYMCASPRNTRNILNQINLIKEKKWQPFRDFNYEIGYLLYESGEHNEALDYFNNCFSNDEKDNFNNLVMIKTIEAVHGSVENKIKVMNLLEKINNNHLDIFYEYWKMHIYLEEGKFSINEFHSLLKKINIAFHVYKENIILRNEYFRLLRRAWTDLLRINCLLSFNSFSSEFIETIAESKKILEDLNCNIKDEYYFYKLFYENLLNHQYQELPKNAIFLRDSIKVEESKNLIIGIYHKLLNSKDISLKNKRTIIGRKLDFDIMIMNRNELTEEQLTDGDQYQFKEEIKKFINESNQSDVKIHEAYGYTLMAKNIMIDILFNNYNANIEKKLREDLSRCIQKSNKIYSTYGNKYGIFRLKFLNELFNICSSPNVNSSSFEKLNELCEKNNYIKEKAISSCLAAYYSDRHEVSKKIVWDAIMFYNIILQ